MVIQSDGDDPSLGPARDPPGWRAYHVTVVGMSAHYVRPDLDANHGRGVIDIIHV